MTVNRPAPSPSPEPGRRDAIGAGGASTTVVQGDLAIEGEITMNAQAVAGFLKDLKETKNVCPCQVTINKTTYVGGRYAFTYYCTREMPEVQNGEKEDGESYDIDYFYLLMDKLPPSCWNVVYVIEDAEWHVVRYYDEGEQNRANPFGNGFWLTSRSPWGPGKRIDYFKQKKRRRVPCKVAYV
jgi:hypothetical protein